MSVFNLSFVDHAQVYNDRWVSEHLHCHAYQEGVDKKGAKNIASLLVKTLQQLNLLHKESVGGELNIIFNNCLGQNKHKQFCG